MINCFKREKERLQSIRFVLVFIGIAIILYGFLQPEQEWPIRLAAAGTAFLLAGFSYLYPWVRNRIKLFWIGFSYLGFGGVVGLATVHNFARGSELELLLAAMIMSAAYVLVVDRLRPLLLYLLYVTGVTFVGLVVSEVELAYSSSQFILLVSLLGVAGIVSLVFYWRIRLERVVAEAESRWQGLVENHPNPITIHTDGILRYVNPAAERILKASKEELLERPVLDFVAPADQEAARKRLSALLAGEKAPAKEYRLVLPNQEERVVEITSVPGVFEGHRGMQSVLRDITEKKRQTDELNRRNQELESLLEISRELRMQHTPKALFDRVTDVVFQMISNADAASIWLFDPGAGSFMRHMKRKGGQQLYQEKVDGVDGSVVEAVMQRSGPVVRNSLEHTPDTQIGTVWKSNQAVIGVPLILEKEPIGAVLVNSFTSDRVFVEHDVRLLSSLAAQVTVAIHNTNLIEKIRKISSKLLQVEEEERRRISRDLHDEVGGLLTSLKLNLSKKPKTNTQALNLVETLLAKVRGLTLNLYPSVLDDLGLVPALEEHIERFAQQTGIKVYFQNALPEVHLAPEVQITLYRVVQEALTNVARHAQIDYAQVFIDYEAPQLTVHVIDEGPGFDLENVWQEMDSKGLLGMQERLDLVGGTLRVDATPGGGTHISAELKINKEVLQPGSTPEELKGEAT